MREMYLMENVCNQKSNFQKNSLNVMTLNYTNEFSSFLNTHIKTSVTLSI